MATKISDLPAATSLDGTEQLELTQAGASKRATAAQIAAASTSGQLAGINNQTGTAYTLALTDKGKDVRCNNAAAVTLTVPTNAAVPFPVGAVVLFSQIGAGVVTATPVSGTVTLNGKNGLATTGQHDLRGLEKTDTDTWRVV